MASEAITKEQVSHAIERASLLIMTASRRGHSVGLHVSLRADRFRVVSDYRTVYDGPDLDAAIEVYNAKAP